MAQNGDKDWFADGDAYELYIGRWGRPIGVMILDWLAQPSGLHWVDVGCGTGALSATVLERNAPYCIASWNSRGLRLGLIWRDAAHSLFLERG